MYRLIIMMMAVLCSASFCLAEDIILDEGQSEEIATGFEVSTVVTGNNKVCRGVPLPDRKKVVINALGPGKTNIILHGSNGEQMSFDVKVNSVEVASTAEELSELLQGVENVTVRQVGRKVVVEGSVLSQANLDMINRVVKDMPNIINMIKPSPAIRKVTRKEIENAIAAEGIPGVRVQIIKDNYVLLGVVPSGGALQQAMTIASSFSPNVINALAVDESVEMKPLSIIELQLNIIEIDRAALKNLGIHWNPVSSSEAKGDYSKAKGAPAASSVGVTGTISDLFPKMRRIFQNGKGRSVVEQSLTGNSGEDADFFVGVQYPLLVPQDGGKYTVEYKDIGVTIKMRPSLQAKGDGSNGYLINTPIELESSSIVGQAAAGIPVINTSKLKTEMSLINNVSVAVGGLISRKELYEISDAPPAGGPSLLQLNSGHNQDNDTREVVVFVTPRVIEFYDDATRKIRHSVEDDFKHQELKALRKAFKEQN